MAFFFSTRRLLGVAGLFVACAAPAWANGLTDLEGFLREIRQGKTTFTQTVTPPRKDGATTTPRARVSSGVFEFQRPDRFRFQYTQPFQQTIVADGQMLWIYDADLQQATARRQQDVLGQTPAALISAAPDLKAMAAVFELSNAPDSEGLRWVQAVPKARDGALQSVRLGFRAGQLAVLEMLDSFGQRSVLAFGPVDTQPGFRPDHFRFTPPAGTEVLRP